MSRDGSAACPPRFRIRSMVPRCGVTRHRHAFRDSRRPDFHGSARMPDLVRRAVRLREENVRACPGAMVLVRPPSREMTAARHHRDRSDGTESAALDGAHARGRSGDRGVPEPHASHRSTTASTACLSPCQAAISSSLINGTDPARNTVPAQRLASQPRPVSTSRHFVVSSA